MNLLHGASVYLTAPTLDDLEVLLPLTDSMDYQRWATLNAAYPRRTPQQHVDWMRDQRAQKIGFHFVIRLQEDDRPIGTCGLRDVDWHSRHAEVGIGIADPADRGQGFGTDAMRVLLRYAFDDVNMHRVGLQVAAYNDAAIKSYEKIGFVVEANLREAVYRDLEYHDVVLMGILESEWRAP